MDNNTDYNYSSAGFDGFLMRSIDKTPQVNLADPGPQTTAIRYDSSQVSGMLGNALQIGNIKLDGVAGRISVYDSNGNESIRIGSLDG
jgi:hypothetical protein